MDANVITNVIRTVEVLSNQFENISRIKGDNFNIFKILKLSTKETRTHSSFLGELLNPKGSHGQKHLFLDLFLDSFRVKDFKAPTADVELEKNCGQLDDESDFGGRIDILLTDGDGNAIAIENKLYARDQRKQIVRSYNYCKNRFKKFRIFYLTLLGDPPSQFSSNNDSRVLSVCDNISYKTDVLQWLISCQKESLHHPFLRETLAQYINLIKHLTDQTMDEGLQKEILRRIINDGSDSVKAVFLITSDIYPSLKRYLSDEFKKQITTAASELDLRFGVEASVTDNIALNASGFYFRPKAWTSFCIGFEFERGSCFYGVKRENRDMVPLDSLSSELERVLGRSGKPSDLWVWWQWLDEPLNWDAHTYDELKNGHLVSKIQRIVEDVLIKTEGMNGL